MKKGRVTSIQSVAGPDNSGLESSGVERQVCLAVEKLVCFEKLEPVYGVPFGRVHLWRLMRDGKFPLSVKTSEGGRAAWLESEIVEWIRTRPRAVTVRQSVESNRVRGRGKVSK